MKRFRNIVLALMGWLYTTFLRKHLGVVAFEGDSTYLGAHWSDLVDRFAMASKYPRQMRFDIKNPPPASFPDEADCKTVWCERCRTHHKPFSKQDWDRTIDAAVQRLSDEVDDILLDSYRKSDGPFRTGSTYTPRTFGHDRHPSGD